MQKHLKAIRGRELHVQYLQGAWDFKEMFEPLDVVVSGLASVKNASDVNHCMHMVQRRDLVDFAGSESWEIENPFKDAFRKQMSAFPSVTGACACIRGGLQHIQYNPEQFYLCQLHSTGRPLSLIHI